MDYTGDSSYYLCKFSASPEQTKVKILLNKKSEYGMVGHFMYVSYINAENMFHSNFPLEFFWAHLCQRKGLTKHVLDL